MKKFLKILVIILFAVFVIVQFIQPDRTNPRIVQSETLETSTQITESVKAIFERSCNDCHTNNTNYPFYSNISPFSWLLAEHIKEGRESLNFSTWNTYETSRKRRKLDEICEQAEDKEMPLPSYLWIHWNAKLTAEDVKVLCDWVETEKERLAKNLWFFVRLRKTDFGSETSNSDKIPAINFYFSEEIRWIQKKTWNSTFSSPLF